MYFIRQCKVLLVVRPVSPSYGDLPLTVYQHCLPMASASLPLCSVLCPCIVVPDSSIRALRAGPLSVLSVLLTTEFAAVRCSCESVETINMGTVEETYEGEITRRKVTRTSLKIQEVKFLSIRYTELAGGERNSPR